ncbi:MAG: SUMF1/EgtB/PvdO family nonheme iron enzyme [Anaerolineales bacterium]|nr:SUMF1/EgtB/PvdO family nonheme iron enzyme [Anaerolineales bacterium]
MSYLPPDSPTFAGDDASELFSGVLGDGRTAAVRYALDDALELWWDRSQLPSTQLLRDGLLALEAGRTLDEAQTGLLLRAALAYRRGMVTALRYQNDPERTAVILSDALLEQENPLTVDELAQLATVDAGSERWLPALVNALREATDSADDVRRTQASSLLEILVGGHGELVDAGQWSVRAAARQEPPRFRRIWLYLLWLALPVVLVAGGIWLAQQWRSRDMIQVAAGSYPVAGAGGDRLVTLAAYAIDRTEVTNAAYRRCVDAGKCSPPASFASAQHLDYYLNPAFNQYPVIAVDWAAASAYCRYTGGRLPTAEEWEVAASFAPATQRRYRYPWGDQFEVQRANGAPAGLGDTLTVGSYTPGGDSPLGLKDAAGNVAEWTVTAGDGGYITKGGSYEDDPAALAAGAEREVAPGLSALWLGVRCAANAPGSSTPTSNSASN